MAVDVVPMRTAMEEVREEATDKAIGADDAVDAAADAIDADAAGAVRARMHFLQRDPKYAREKPYTLRYAPAPESGLAQTNIARVEHAVVFRDLRGQPDLLESDGAYDACGFRVVTLDGPEHEQLPYEAFADAARVEGEHAPRVLAAVRAALGAASAELVDYVVRRRHAAWPVSTGEPYAFQQPASRAHIDHTYAGAVDIIRAAHGADADAVLARRWQLVNAWHPLRGPLVDWPLAVCDARSVDFARDTMAGDVVDRHQVFENTQVHYDPRQRWYYLRGQMPHELVVFKNADSATPAGAAPGVPHAAFDNPLTTDADFRRESLEMRILVVW